MGIDGVASLGLRGLPEGRTVLPNLLRSRFDPCQLTSWVYRQHPTAGPHP